MRGVMLFAAGLFAGLALQVMTAQDANSGVVMMNHVGISVPNIAEAVTYYTQKMGYREAFRVNDELRSSNEPLPRELGLTGLIAFAEAKFGIAPREYWKAFRQVALKLELRRAAVTEYQLAARKPPKPEGPK